MIFNGKQVTFKATIGALADISRRCPEGKIENVEKLFEGATADILDNTCYFISRLSGGTITEEEARDLTYQELAQLQDAAQSAFQNDSKPSIEVEVKNAKATGDEKAETMKA